MEFGFALGLGLQGCWRRIEILPWNEFTVPRAWQVGPSNRENPRLCTPKCGLVLVLLGILLLLVWSSAALKGNGFATPTREPQDHSSKTRGIYIYIYISIYIYIQQIKKYMYIVYIYICMYEVPDRHIPNTFPVFR